MKNKETVSATPTQGEMINLSKESQESTTAQQEEQEPAHFLQSTREKNLQH